ncbi:ARL14 effector protein-like [Sipha flava]|uniref:ARL14 effector protein-like n=1 Tax=Sipha flava TaxID=143950 RepID=A0A8B8GH06_9HEMI|nr:ARL14 effector protein-like [Sipha flava]
MSSSNTYIPPLKKKKKDLIPPVSVEVKHESVPNSLPIDSDPCDCLDTDCPGCFLPCESCGSVKCGVFCRVGRDWNNVFIKVDGEYYFPQDVETTTS